MRFSLFAAAAVAAVLVAACDKPDRTQGPPPPKVDGEHVVFATNSPQLSSLVSEPATERPAPAASLNGRLAWNEDKTVRVFSPLAGRVDRILVQPGDRVQAGQTLAVIASADLGQAQAEAHRAQGDYLAAEKNLARAKELHEHGVAAAKDLNAAEAEYARADSEMKRTRARLKLYGGGSQVDQSFALKSPLTGTVVEKSINPGQELRPDQMGGNTPAQFVITDPAYLWVLLDAAEKDLPHLKVGRTIKVRVPAYPDETFEAKIAAVADFLDPATRTIKVRATLDNARRRLKSEMFVTASVEDGGASILQVPVRAVFFQSGSNYVFVDDGNGSYTRQRVETADAHEGNIAITAGVKPGQKVVTEGALLLQQLLQPRRVVK